MKNLRFLTEKMPDVKRYLIASTKRSQQAKYILTYKDTLNPCHFESIKVQVSSSKKTKFSLVCLTYSTISSKFLFQMGTFSLQFHVNRTFIFLCDNFKKKQEVILKILFKKTFIKDQINLTSDLKLFFRSSIHILL